MGFSRGQKGKNMRAIRNERELRGAKTELELACRRQDTLGAWLKKIGVSPERQKENPDYQSNHHHILGLRDAIWLYECDWEELAAKQFDFSELGQLLIVARVKLGITQRCLAEWVGVHESQVSRYERDAYAGASLKTMDFFLNMMGVKINVGVGPTVIPQR